MNNWVKNQIVWDGRCPRTEACLYILNFIFFPLSLMHRPMLLVIIPHVISFPFEDTVAPGMQPFQVPAPGPLCQRITLRYWDCFVCSHKYLRVQSPQDLPLTNNCKRKRTFIFISSFPPLIRITLKMGSVLCAELPRVTEPKLLTLGFYSMLQAWLAFVMVNFMHQLG